MSANDMAKVGQLSEPGEYDAAMLELLQLLWGDGFLSPGGSGELDRLFEGSNIRGCEVLDIGCGLGAIDELLVTRFGARSVMGIDIDPSLVSRMQHRVERAGLSDRIRGAKVDGGALPFAAASFDVVFSKDSMVQIPDKPEIYAEVLRVLRPGGRFIASDWLRGGSGSYSQEMMEFFRLEGIAYNMVTLEESAAALAAAGFADVEIRDRHGWYLALAQQELEALQGPLNPVIVSRIGAERARHFVEDWRQLVMVVKRGELRPGHLKAVKPGSGAS
ncbi:MAG TPA: methyltransferase domain-containing protein [Steroidobacteraceae bacterium]|jgi:phosphoethanolamine N-methyltransferase|nr:methyltransferase domain-containing protein [Steroidobacteraceae bacterium]